MFVGWTPHRPVVLEGNRVDLLVAVARDESQVLPVDHGREGGVGVKHDDVVPPCHPGDLVVNVDVVVRRESLRNVGDLLVVVGELLKRFLHSVVEEVLPLLEPEQIPWWMTSRDVDVPCDKLKMIV